MPFAVSFGVEAGASIVRGIGVTVKVDRDEVTIAERERSHWSTWNEHDAHDRDRTAREAQRRSHEWRDREWNA